MLLNVLLPVHAKGSPFTIQPHIKANKYRKKNSYTQMALENMGRKIRGEFIALARFQNNSLNSYHLSCH